MTSRWTPVEGVPALMVLDLSPGETIADLPLSATVEFPIADLPPELAYALGVTDRPAPIPPPWYLAICRRCGDDLGQPFRDEHERDTWAARHVADSGHVVQLTIDGSDRLDGLHMSAVLQREPISSAGIGAGGFRYLCPADDCSPASGPARWSKPYATPQLAIAAWRSHGPAGDRAEQ